MFAPSTEKSRTDSAAWRREQEARRLRQQGHFSVSLCGTTRALSLVQQSSSGISGSPDARKAFEVRSREPGPATNVEFAFNYGACCSGGLARPNCGRLGDHIRG